MIEIKNITYQYPHSNQYALNDINLHIAQGEAVGILGPNGAGKSTLMMLLANLLPLQQGEIYFDQVKYQQLSSQQKQKFSLVPQDFAFYPLLTVWENMLFFASLYQITDRLFLTELLLQTALLEYKHKLAKTLSGGLKRRLNFAIGLINSPQIIFLDEITVGIDVESREFILQSVAQLTEQNVTVIYTSHYLQEIEKLCSKVVLLHQGQIVFDGDLAQILTNKKEVFCLKTNPELSPEHLSELGLICEDKGNNLYRTIELPIEQVLANLIQAHYQVVHINYGYDSLEKFYLQFLQSKRDKS